MQLDELGIHTVTVRYSLRLRVYGYLQPYRKGCPETLFTAVFTRLLYGYPIQQEFCRHSYTRRSQNGQINDFWIIDIGLRSDVPYTVKIRVYGCWQPYRISYHKEIFCRFHGPYLYGADPHGECGNLCRNCITIA